MVLPQFAIPMVLPVQFVGSISLEEWVLAIPSALKSRGETHCFHFPLEWKGRRWKSTPSHARPVGKRIERSRQGAFYPCYFCSTVERGLKGRLAVSCHVAHATGMELLGHGFPHHSHSNPMSPSQ